MSSSDKETNMQKLPVAKPERLMTIRVYGNILYTTGVWAKDGNVDKSAIHPLRPEGIDDWMQDCVKAGATGVLWQSNLAGLSTHPSPVLHLAGPPFEPKQDAWKEVWGFLGEQLRRFDTLAEGIAAAHRNGLRFIYSMCLWDLMGEGFSPFDPDLWMQSYAGESLVGVPCYADPQAQRLMIEHLKNVLDRGVDDLAISPFAHTMGYGEDIPDYYCYSPSLRKAYKARYGVELTPETIDPVKWTALYGGLYTDFLRQVHKETAQRGQRFIPFTTPDGTWGWGGTGGKEVYNHNVLGAPEPTVDPGCPIQFQHKKWAEEGIIEGLLVVAPPDNAVEITAQVGAETGKPVLLWQNATPGSTEEQWAGFRREAAKVGKGMIDGYALHSMIMVKYADYPDHLWAVLREAAGKAAP